MRYRIAAAFVAMTTAAVSALPLTLDSLPVASAAPQQVPGGSTLTAYRTSVLADGPDVISCTGEARQPHNSKHVPGTINGVVNVTCSYWVEKTSISPSLWRSGHLVKRTNKVIPGKMYTEFNVAIPCHAGTYKTRGDYVVTFPPEYSPRTLRGGHTSGARSLTC